MQLEALSIYRNYTDTPLKKSILIIPGNSNNELTQISVTAGLAKCRIIPISK